MTITTTKRQIPSIEELRSWAVLSSDDLDARIGDMFDRADEYEHPVDLRSYRQGFEDALERQSEAALATTAEPQDVDEDPQLVLAALRAAVTAQEATQ